MSSHNITTTVTVVATAMWIGAVILVSTMSSTFLSTVVGMVAAPLGGISILLLLNGDRIWISFKSDTLLPKIHIKPRGYSAGASFNTGKNSGGTKVRCNSCGTEFDKLNDHIRTDSKHYCGECSQVGEMVIHNYKQWFETTKDVRESAD